jgi:AcrR family transcriptional regulator
MADIGRLLGMRAPSLYNHVGSKQEILQDVMLGTMKTLLADHAAAVASTDDVAEQLRRVMEAHIRYHTRFRREAHVGNREIPSLQEPVRAQVLRMRDEYAKSWQALIERGVLEERFSTRSPQLAAYAMLDMGIGVARWFHPAGPISEAEVAFFYGDVALRLVGATPGLNLDGRVLTTQAGPVEAVANPSTGA